MIIKTCKLNGTELNWAVARAIGCEFKTNSIGATVAYLEGKLLGGFVTRTEGGVAWPSSMYSPSTNWLQGGPLLDQERIATSPGRSFQEGEAQSGWTARNILSEDDESEGATMLTAGMRCLVRSKLGPEVDVPDEFVR